MAELGTLTIAATFSVSSQRRAMPSRVGGDEQSIVGAGRHQRRPGGGNLMQVGFRPVHRPQGRKCGLEYLAGFQHGVEQNLLSSYEGG